LLDSSLPNQSDYKTSLMDNNGIFRFFSQQELWGPIYLVFIFGILFICFI